MGGTTTRGRKKAAAAEAEPTAPADAAAAHDNELQARMEQLMASLTAAEEERTVFEAEMRQKITEVKFEQQKLRERYEQVVASQKEQLDAHHDLQLQHVAIKSSVATLERHLDRFLSVLRASSDSPGVTSRVHTNDQHRREHQNVDVDAGSDIGSDTSFAAESRVSELSDIRSAVSTAASTARYAHSSIEAARKALKQRQH